MTYVKTEIRTVSRLAAPLVITQLGGMAMGMVDILMVARVGTEALGAVSLGRLMVFGISLLGHGLLLGLDPLLTQGHGAKNRQLLGLTLQRGLVLAGALGIGLGACLFVTETVLLAVGQDPELARVAHRYALVQIPSLIPFYVYLVLRQYLQGRSITRPAMWVVIGANLANVFLNWMLIFGNLGAPRLEVEGAGIATAITRVLMCAALVVWVLRTHLTDDAWIPWSRRAFALRGFLPILRYGSPLALHVALEMWAFQTATLMAGKLGTAELAAHTVAINLVSFSFMVPLGVSMAAVTRVGNLIGKGKPKRAQLASYVSLGMGAAFMVFAAVLFLIFREPLVALYSQDPAVIALAVLILPIGATFQLFDGVQVVCGGILRGMGNTTPAAVFNLVAFYFLALPLAGWLAFRQGWGLAGVWWGLAIGLAVIASLLVLYIWRRGPARVNARIAEVA